MKTRYVSIGHRIQALVLAVVMVFTSLNISTQGHAEERWTPSNSIILETDEYVSVAFELTSYSKINGIEFDIATIEGSAFIKASIVNTDTNKTVWETNPNMEISHEKAMNEWDIHNVPIALNKEVKAGNYAIIIENTSSARAIIKYDGTVNTGNEVTGSSIGGGNYGKCISVNTSTITPTEYRLTSEDYPSIETTGEATIAINVTNSSQTVALSLGGMNDEDDSITFASDLPCSIMSTSRTSANITISTSGKYTITATTDDGGKAIFYIYALRAEDASAKTYNGAKQAPSGFAIKAGDAEYSIEYSRADGVLENPINAGTYKYSLSLARDAITGVSGFSAEANFVINKATLGSASVDDITYEGGVYSYDNLMVFDTNSAKVDSDKYLVDSVSEALSSDGVTIDYTINIVANDSNYEGATSVTKTLSSAGQASGTGHVIDLSLLTAEVTDGNLIYNGTDNPDATVVLKNGGSTIASEVIDIANDCNISYRFDDEKLNVGNVTITVSPKENSTKLKGYTTARAYVNPLDIGTINLTVTGSSVNATNKTISQQKYDAGKAIVFGTDLKLIHGSKELIEGTDYQLVYSNNTEVSSVSGEPASLTIKGIGNYRGQVTYKYDIVGTFKDRVSLQYTVDGTTYRADASAGYKLRNYNPVYNGSDITLGSYNLFVDNEYISPAAYTVTYSSDHKNAGEASIIFTLNSSTEAEAIKNKYYATSQADATIDFKFTIQQKLISSDSITVTIPNKKYNGSEQEILLTRLGDIVVKDGATVLDGASITVESYKGKNVGSNYDVIIRARADGNYRGVRTEKWAIEKLDISRAESNVTVADIGQVEYTGDRQDIARLMLGKVKINGTVIESTNNYKYIIYNSNNIIVNQATEIGTYRIEITAEDDGNLTGTATQRAALEITPKKMNLIVKYKGNTLGYITGSDKDVIIPSTTKTWDYTGSRVLLKTSDFTVIDSKTNTELVRDKEWDFVTPSDSSINVTRVPSDTYTTIRIKKANIYDNSAERVKVHFTISSRSVANVTVEDQNSWVKSGGKNYPVLLVKYTNSDAIFKDTTELVFGTDYDLVEIDGTDLTTPGTGKRVKIVGRGNYTGEKEVSQSFTLGKNLSDLKTKITLSPAGTEQDEVHPLCMPGYSVKSYDIEYNGDFPTVTVTRDDLPSGSNDITSKVDITYRKYDDGTVISPTDDYLKNYTGGDRNYIIVEITPKVGQAEYFLEGDRVVITYRIIKKAGKDGNLLLSAGFNTSFDDKEEDYNRNIQKIYYQLKLTDSDVVLEPTDYTVTVKNSKNEVVATSNGLKEGGVAYLTIPKEKANADDNYVVSVSATNSSSFYSGLENANSVSGLKIKKVTITETMVGDIDDVPYTGQMVKPDVVITHNGERLEKGIDYEITYDNNTNIKDRNAATDAPVARIIGKGNYVTASPIERNFTIKAKELNDDEFEIIIKEGLVFEFNGKPKRIPANQLTVINKKNNTPLTADEDYTVSYTNETFPGNARVIITAKEGGSYSGSIYADFKIMMNLSTAVLIKGRRDDAGTEQYLEPGTTDTWKDMNPNTVYVLCNTIDSEVKAISTGVTPKTFQVCYYSGTEWISQDNCIEDLTNQFKEITYPGNHKITLNGVKSEFAYGDMDIYVKAVGNLNDATVVLSNDSVFWNGHVDDKGGKNVPAIEVLFNGKNISGLCDIDSAIKEYQETAGGEVGNQTIRIKPLNKDGVDYREYFDDNSFVDAKFRVVYDLSKATLEDKNALLDADTGNPYHDYTGEEVKPVYEITITENGETRTIPSNWVDWSYSNNIKATTSAAASVKVKAKDDPTAFVDQNKEKTESFWIKGVDISIASVTVGPDDKPGVAVSAADLYHTPYNGQKQYPSVKVTINTDGKDRVLKANEDYVLVGWANNQNASTSDNRAKFVVKGINGYADSSINAEFMIDKLDLATAEIELKKPATEYKYMGGTIEVKPEFTLYHMVDGEKLIVAEDQYTIPDVSPKYTGQTGYGGASIYVKAKEESNVNYRGETSKTYTIHQMSLDESNPAIKVVSTDMEYTGQAQITPDVEIAIVDGENVLYTLVKGTDYEILESLVDGSHGEKDITIQGINGFKDIRNEKIRITKRKISNAAITKTYTTAQSYTGSVVMPTDLVLVDTGIDDYELKLGTDYEITPGKYNMNSGAAYSSDAMLVEPPSGPYIIVTAKETGSYEGVVYLPFSIGEPINTDESSLTLSKYSDTYTGYKQNNIGYTVNINGRVAGSREYAIEIYKGDDRVVGVELEKVTEIKDAGVYTIKAIPTGAYYGEMKAYYEVLKRDPKLEDGEIVIELPSEMWNRDHYETKYTGSYINPPVKVYDKKLAGADRNGYLIPETEYEVRYSENNKDVSDREVGKVASVIVVFKGINYEKKEDRFFIQDFYITEGDASDVEVEVKGKKIYYDNAGDNLSKVKDWAKENLVVKYKGAVLENTDYTVSYEFSGEDRSVPCIGAIKLTIEGKGNFSGTKVVEDSVGMYALIEDADNPELFDTVLYAVEKITYGGHEYRITKELKKPQYGDPISDKAVLPSIPTLQLGGKTISEAGHYVFSQVARKNGEHYGYGYVVITPSKNYDYIEGSCLVVGYEIKKDVENLLFKLVDSTGRDFALSRTWTGLEQKPGYVIQAPNGEKMVENGVIFDTDSIASVGEVYYKKDGQEITSNIGLNPGEYTVGVVVRPKDGSPEPMEEKFTVAGIDLDNLPENALTVVAGSIYQGVEQKPTVILKVNGNIVSSDQYNVEYENNIGPNGNKNLAGSIYSEDVVPRGKVTVTPKEENSALTGTAVAYFDIKVEKPSIKEMNVTSNKATISWKKVWGGLEGDSVSYVVEIEKKSGGGFQQRTVTNGLNVITLEGLEPRQDYNVRVYTVMARPISDGSTEKRNYYSDPTKDTFLTEVNHNVSGSSVTPQGGTSTAGTAKLTWTNLNPNPYWCFNIYRSTTKDGKYELIASVPAEKAEYQNKNLEKGKTYYYMVEGVEYDPVTKVFTPDTANRSKPVPITIQ